MANLIRLICVFLIFIQNPLFSQEKFYKIYGGSGYDRGYGILQVKDSGYAICGTTSSFADAPSQAYFARLNKSGNILFANAYGGTESEEARDITTAGKKHFFISGFSTSGSSGSFDTYSFLIDTSGTLIWEKRLDFGGWEQWNDGVELSDSSIFLVGKSESTMSSDNAHIFARISFTGDTIFTKKINFASESNLTGVWKYTDTSVVVCGSIYNADSLHTKAYLAVIHNNGTIIWEKQYGIHGEFRLSDITMRGTEIFSCGYHPIGNTSAEYNLVTDFYGNMIYGFEITDNYVTRNLCLAKTSFGGNGFIVGYQKENASFPTFVDGEDVFIGKYDGGLFWYNGVGYSNIGQDQTNEIFSTMDGSAVAIGYHSNVGELSNTIFIVKLGPDLAYPSNTEPTVVYNVTSVQTIDFVKIEVFPNPFESTIHLEVDRKCELKIVNLEGQIVVNESIESSKDLNLEMLKSGMYILHLVGELGTKTVKIQKM